MNTVFLIDGFNFYYSIKNLKPRIRWFDYKKFCLQYLNNFNKNISIYDIFYFTAVASWLPDVEKRHNIFIEAQKNNDIKVILGQFKVKKRCCSHCDNCFDDHEEKMTDVNIALYAYRLASIQEVEQIVIISGDSDLIPVVNLIKKDFPNKIIGFLFPPERASKEIKKIADFAYNIKAKCLTKYQLPDIIKSNNGTILHRPKKWS